MTVLTANPQAAPIDLADAQFALARLRGSEDPAARELARVAAADYRRLGVSYYADLADAWLVAAEPSGASSSPE